MGEPTCAACDCELDTSAIKVINRRAYRRGVLRGMRPEATRSSCAPVMDASAFEPVSPGA
jgi:hypothetical protein